MILLLFEDAKRIFFIFLTKVCLEYMKCDPIVSIKTCSQFFRIIEKGQSYMTDFKFHFEKNKK